MKIGKKLVAIVMGVSAVMFSLSGVASAHVTVKPVDVQTGAYQVFTVSVPVEKDQPTTVIKLQMPEAITSATPTVKRGWTINVEKQGTGENAVVKSITWSGGEIGSGLRDEFSFSAKTPDKTTELQWKAYQTYEDGTVVSWDQKPSEKHGDAEGEDTGPFSVTQVTSETAQEAAMKHLQDDVDSAKQTANWALYASVGGIILALGAIFAATRQKETR